MSAKTWSVAIMAITAAGLLAGCGSDATTSATADSPAATAVAATGTTRKAAIYSGLAVDLRNATGQAFPYDGQGVCRGIAACEHNLKSGTLEPDGLVSFSEGGGNWEGGSVETFITNSRGVLWLRFINPGTTVAFRFIAWAYPKGRIEYVNGANGRYARAVAGDNGSYPYVVCVEANNRAVLPGETFAFKCMGMKTTITQAGKAGGDAYRFGVSVNSLG